MLRRFFTPHSRQIQAIGASLLAAFGTVAAARTAHADGPDRVVWEGQGWQVAAMTNDRRFVGCYAMKDFFNVDGFGQRVRFVFANYRDDHWAGLIGGSNTETITNTSLRLVVDGETIVNTTTGVASANAVRLGRISSDAVDQIAAGDALEMRTSNASAQFDLTGSAPALGKTVECVNRALAEEIGTTATLRQTYRVPRTVSDGFLSLRDGPSGRASVILKIPGGERGIQLDGCQQSIDRGSPLQWCRVKYGNSIGWVVSYGLMAEAARSAPTQPYVLAPPSQPQQALPSTFWPREKLLPVIHGFMSEAGITSYKVDPPKSDSDNFEVTWLYEDATVSALLVIEPVSKMSLQDVADYSGKQSASACKGEFALIRTQSRYFQGSEIQKVETRCKGPKGAIAVGYSIVELPTGVIMRFSHWAPTAGQSSEPEQRHTQRAMQLENAAITSAGQTRR